MNINQVSVPFWNGLVSVNKTTIFIHLFIIFSAKYVGQMEYTECKKYVMVFDSIYELSTS